MQVLLLLSASVLALPAGAAVYKCEINGQTRYQDEPCPGDRDAAPHLEYEADPEIAPEPEPPAASADGVEPEPEPPPRWPPVPAVPEDEGPMDRVAQLGVDIEVAEAELRTVVDQRRLALGALDRRIAADPDNEGLKDEREQREAAFRERHHDVSERLRHLRADLAQACPHGTFRNGTRLACR